MNDKEMMDHVFELIKKRDDYRQDLGMITRNIEKIDMDIKAILSKYFAMCCLRINWKSLRRVMKENRHE